MLLFLQSISQFWLTIPPQLFQQFAGVKGEGSLITTAFYSGYRGVELDFEEN